MVKDFRERLLAKQQLFGTMISLPSSCSAEVLAESGFDWFFVDGEHGPLGTSEVLRILQAVSQRVACIVRVPEAAEVPIKKMLDIGAQGIIVPQVNSADVAAQVVQWCKYAPLGTRGVGLGRAHAYGAKFAEYVENANQEVSVIVQVEHKIAVENIEEIVSVDGIDLIQLGPYDLSASMGRMGQIDDPEVAGAIDHVGDVCRRNGIAIGSFGLSPTAIKRDIARGANLICAATDTVLLQHAASKMLQKIR